MHVCLLFHDTLFFQFTTSQGGRPLISLNWSRTLKLSIHDLTRRSTLLREGYTHTTELSIHDLTRRSTLVVPTSRCSRRLSIHDLTRRSTVAALKDYVDGFFQFTTSQGGRPESAFNRAFASSFQFTTSQGGRQLAPIRVGSLDVFQFTTSQGGRLYLIIQDTYM